MSIGPDVQVFISAARALLQSLNRRTLTEEERGELKTCLKDLDDVIPREPGRQAA